MPNLSDNRIKGIQLCLNKKTPINAFKAQIDVYGHKFILYAFNPKDLGIWFNSIMEVLGIGI